MLKIHILEQENYIEGIFRVALLEQLHNEWQSDQNLLVPVNCYDDLKLFKLLKSSGLENIYPLFKDESIQDHELLGFTLTDQQLHQNDVVSVDGRKGSIFILLRESDLHHSLFLTNQCNNYCLMCSQPPTKHDDSWLVEQALTIINHINFKPLSIGITGGEPLLIGDKLLLILNALHDKLPDTKIELLTNGKILSEPNFQKDVLLNLPSKVHWLVPLYGHVEELHDFIVQSHGAFEQTIEGLYFLQKISQTIQLRIVLVKPVLENLNEICQYIIRNLPFVKEVAFIGCEPIGFALANTDISKVDISEWSNILDMAVNQVDMAGLKPVIMNIPLCCLPKSLWRFSSRSISDWKQTYHTECQKCDLLESCCGLFQWYQKGWMPSKIQAIHLLKDS